MKRFTGRVEGGRLFSPPGPERHHQCQVLWRGYLANGEEILGEARRRRVPLGDGSEGELFALAYRWWGDALQSHLLGEYAVALFDELTSSLFLTQDAPGLVSLFFCSLPEGLLFGSHLEDLALEPGVGELDEEYIADYVATCAHTSQRTAFRGIRRLGLGCSVTYQAPQIMARGSWDLHPGEPLQAEECRIWQP